MNEVIVGTYEGFLLGYTTRTEESTILKQTFATHSHTASVRCMSTAGKFLASGGTDDKVVVIDLKTRKEHTVLMNHDGTINSLAFTHNGTHLLSGSDDGSIIVTRTGNWQVEKIWKKAHGGKPVTAIAVHPSNKLALSLGGDKTLRTWNLVKGRPAFTINLASKQLNMPSDIVFSPGGDRFSLISEQTVVIWTISKAGIEKKITCNSKPTAVQWVTDERIFVGLENGNILGLTVSDTKANTYCASRHRLKSLYYENNLLYTASSTGELKVWSVTDSDLSEVCSHNAACRVTCITLNKQDHLIKKEELTDDKTNEKTDSKDIEDNSEDSGVNEVESFPDRKPGAFVTISYDDDKLPEGPPPAKKLKKKNKKSKNKKPKQ